MDSPSISDLLVLERPVSPMEPLQRDPQTESAERAEVFEVCPINQLKLLLIPAHTFEFAFAEAGIFEVHSRLDIEEEADLAWSASFYSFLALRDRIDVLPASVAIAEVNGGSPVSEVAQEEKTTHLVADPAPTIFENYLASRKRVRDFPSWQRGRAYDDLIEEF